MFPLLEEHQEPPYALCVCVFVCAFISYVIYCLYMHTNIYIYTPQMTGQSVIHVW